MFQRIARVLPALLLGAALLGAAPPAQAAAIGAPAPGAPQTTVLVPLSEVPEPGRRLSSERVLAIADEIPSIRRVRAQNRGSFAATYLKGHARWQVSYYTRAGNEIGQAIIDDATGKVLERWTGFQLTWTMARGYKGAFGGHADALYIWLPLCLLFLVPFVDPRRLLCLRHLDLLVLLSLSVSLAFFNHARIYASVPLAYPPLIYLMCRALTLARPRLHSAHPSARFAPAPPPAPLRLRIPTLLMAVGVMFLIGFRIGLNVADSSVIDVGYSGLVGAERIVDSRPLYGGYPKVDAHGDTYGPVNYEAYVPFEQLFGWSGHWDDLPAAHAAAIFFDLLAVGLLFLLGRQLGSVNLGVALAYAWVSYPFTLFALDSNSNDSLVAVLILASLLLARSSRRGLRGALAALAALTKFAPLAIAPLLATHGLRELPRDRRPRALALFGAGFLVSAAIVMIPALRHDSLEEVYNRTVLFQSTRNSPFSIWGLYGGLGGLQETVLALAALLALLLAVLPRRSDVVGLAGACAAVIIAVQLGVEHWFYLYIPWFFAPLIVALLGDASTRRLEPGPLDSAAPSGPARSSPLAVAAKR